MKKTEAREQAFKILYSLEVQKEYETEQINIYIKENEITDEDEIRYIKNVINGIIENKNQIEKIISENLKKDWTIQRISTVNLSILEIAIFEMNYKKVPYKIVINEAVELAKKYGDNNSKSFVNGILASILKQNTN